MKEDTSEVLNNAFENLHPQLKVVFTEIEPGRYEFETTMFDQQGKFKRGSGGELALSRIEDERFPAMVKGSAKGLASMFTNEEDIISFVEGPEALIIEHILTDNTLSTTDDFAAKLDSSSARRQLMIQEYIFREAEEAGVDMEGFSENDEALSILGSFQLSFSLPPMEELGKVVDKLVRNPKNWPLLARWIKEWAGASQWSMNEAWEDGPLIEEIIAYGTFKMIEKEVDPNNKPGWWPDLYIMADICLDFTSDDLKRSGFSS